MAAPVAYAQVCGPQWLPGDSFAVLDAQVLCLTAWDPDGPVGPREPVLVAGGAFQKAGSQTVNQIAMWDGAHWHPMGDGHQTVVTALAVTKDGELLAGGALYINDDRTDGFVIRWNGSEWHPLGAGFDAGVRGLAVGPDGSIYAAGSFTQAEGRASRAISRWDGSAWQPVGTGTEVVDGGAYTVAALPNGDVVVGGALSWFVNNVRWSFLGKWDGANWTTMNANPNERPWCMAVQPDGKLLVGGEFSQIGGISARSIARWDGTAWSSIGSLFVGTVMTISYASDTDLVVGGTIRLGGSYRGIARWNGSAWTQLGTGLNPFASLYDVAASVRCRGEIIAGGRFQTSGGLSSPFVARWTENHAPWIAVQPVDTTPSPDRTAAFTVELAAQSGDATYQWRRNGVPLEDQPDSVSGSDSAELRLSNTTVCDAGTFDCIVTTACGTVTSNSATLAVCPGDLTGDGLVDDADFVRFVASYHVLLVRDAAMELRGPADFNCDGVVDDADFVIFVAAYDEMLCS